MPSSPSRSGGPPWATGEDPTMRTAASDAPGWWSGDSPAGWSSGDVAGRRPETDQTNEFRARLKSDRPDPSKVGHPGDSRSAWACFVACGVSATGPFSSSRLVLHGPHHRRRRLLRESLLDSPHVGIPQPGQDLVRPGEGQDVVPDRPARPIPFDEEPLLARLGVARQGPVGEAEPRDRTLLLDDVDDPAGVEPPEAEA